MKTLLHCSAAMYTRDGAVLNVGDEGLTAVLARALSELPDVRVVRAIHRLTPGVPRFGAGTVDARPLAQLIGHVRAADAVILGGGTLLQADKGLLRWQLLVALAAKAAGTQLFISHIGAENLHGPYGAVAGLIARSATRVTVRDERSQRALGRVARCPPIVTADAMFMHPPVRPDAKRRSVAVNLKPGYGDTLTRALADALVERTAEHEDLLLAPFDRRDDWDTATLRAFERAVGGRRQCRWISADSGPDAVLSDLAGCRLAVGVRLHFQIFAAIAGASVCGLGREDKALAFAEETGIMAVEPSVDAASLGEALDRAHPMDAETLMGLRERAFAGVAVVAEGLRA